MARGLGRSRWDRGNRCFRWMPLGALCVWVAAGCGSEHGFAAGLVAPKSPAWMSSVTDADIRRALESTVTVAPPVRVVLVDPGGDFGYRWAADDEQLMTRSFDRLVDADLVSDIVIATADNDLARPDEHATTHEYLKSSRLAAARRHGDVAIAITASADDDSWMNPLGLFYLSIVGFWLAPGSQHDVAARVDAVAVDVRDGTLLATASGEGHVSRVRPWALLDERADRREAEQLALRDMFPQLADRLREALRSARRAS